MGKKNRVKQLVGKFRRELGAEIIALPYLINGIEREMRLTMDLENDTALICTNIPHFLAETLIKTIFSKMLDAQIVHVQFKSSTALHGDLQTGYRAGHLVFSTIQDRKRAFDACKALKRPVDLADVGFKTPAWHKSASAAINSRKRSHSSENTAEKFEKNVEMDFKPNDDDEWIVVKPKDKFSFHGKINRISNVEVPDSGVGSSQNQVKKDCEIPRKKKRIRRDK